MAKLKLILLLLIPLSAKCALFDGRGSYGYQPSYQGYVQPQCEAPVDSGKLLGAYNSLSPTLSNHDRAESINLGPGNEYFCSIPAEHQYPNLPMLALPWKPDYGVILNGVTLKSPYSDWSIPLCKIKSKETGTYVIDTNNGQAFLVP